MQNRPTTAEMRATTAAVRANVPVLIWGLPGQGKTQMSEGYFPEWGFGPVETIVGSVREPTDLLGLPFEDNGSTGYLIPSFVKRLQQAKGGMVLLDEFNTCSASTQAAFLRGVQERVFGEAKLPDETRIVAIANPPDYAPNPRELAPSTVNRFLHVDWRLNLGSWLEGIISGFDNVEIPALEAMAPTPTNARIAMVRSAVRGFIEANPQALSEPPTDFTGDLRGYPSPRSWHNVAKVLPWIDENDQEAQSIAVSGLVGSKRSIELDQYLRQMDLIDPRVVLADPTALDVRGTRIDLVFSLAWSVRSMVDMGEDTDLAQSALAVFEHIAASKPDVAQSVMVGFIADLHQRFPGVKMTSSQAEIFGSFLRDLGAIKAA